MDVNPQHNSTAAPASLNFIPDVVANVDEFGGTHVQVADAVTQAIAANARLKVLGLFGVWGGGKSTVVHLASKSLLALENPKFKVFLFDAWLHQGDAPRRAFIEALAEFLIAPLKESDATWRDDLDRLTGRTEVTQTLTIPHLSLGAKVTLWASLTFPLGMVALGRFDAVAKQWPQLGDTFGLRIAVALLAFPFAVALLVKCVQKAKDGWDAMWARLRRKPTAEELEATQATGLAALIKKEAEKTTKRVIKDPTPTTIEFRTLFRKIVSAALGERRPMQPRLIIVVDNLDRLGESEAMEVWSIVRSLFVGPEESSTTEPPFDLTVIFPIDENVLKRTAATGSGTNGEIDAFVDKTFDLVISLPRPLFFHWHTYFRKQLARMFGAHLDAQEIESVAQIADAHFRADLAIVTPRRVNVMVNRIGVLWLQWKSAGISTASIAHYAINRKAIDGNIWEAVGKDPFVARLDPEWAPSICAMHFGVPPGAGIDVLMEAQLQKVFLEPNKEVFHGLANLNGFSVVLTRIVARFLEEPQLAVDRVLNAIELLGGFVGSSQDSYDLAWKDLRRSFMRADRPVSGAPRNIRVLVSLFPRLTARQAVEVVNAGLDMLGYRQTTDPWADDDVAHAAFVVEQLDHALATYPSSEQDTLPAIAVPGVFDNLVALKARLGPGGALLSRLTMVDPVTDANAITTGPENYQAAFPAVADARFLALAQSPMRPNWKTYLFTTAQVLRGTLTGPFPTALLAIAVLKQRGEEGAVELFDEMTRMNGVVAHRLANQFQEQRTLEFARSLVLLLVANVTGLPPSTPAPKLWLGRMPDLAANFSQAMSLMTSERELSGELLTRLKLEVPELFGYQAMPSQDADPSSGL